MRSPVGPNIVDQIDTFDRKSALHLINLLLCVAYGGKRGRRAIAALSHGVMVYAWSNGDSLLWPVLVYANLTNRSGRTIPFGKYPRKRYLAEQIQAIRTLRERMLTE